MDQMAPSLDREIHTIRVFGATPAIVFRAWTDPEMIARWWGPRGFTVETDRYDCRPGGSWIFVMRGPDGQEFPQEIRFVEIVPGERLVMRHATPPLFTFTVLFEPYPGNKTRISFRQTFDDPAVFDAVKHLAIPGNEELFDKLAREIDHLAGEKDFHLRLIRRFPGPREAVWPPGPTPSCWPAGGARAASLLPAARSIPSRAARFRST